MRKIIRSEMSYSEPVSFDLEVYTMLKREDLDYLEKEIASLKDRLSDQVVQVLAYKVLVSELDEEIASLKELLERALPKVMDRKYARALDKKDYSEEVQWQKDYDVLLKTTQARKLC